MKIYNLNESTLTTSASPASLSEKAMLARVTIHQWTARKFDKKAVEHVVRATGASKQAGRFTKYLIPREALKGISRISSQMRDFHYEQTLPWLDDGYRILPVRNYQNYVTRMSQLKELFQEQVGEFLMEYADLREKARFDLGELFNPAEYPTVDLIREKFGVEISVIPLPHSEDFRVSLNQQELDSLKTKLEEEVSGAYKKAIKDLWFRLYEPVKELAERLKDPEARFKVNLLHNISEIVQLLPTLNLDDDPALEQMRRDVERTLCGLNPESLRKNPQFRQETAEQAEALSKVMAGYMGNL